MKKFLFSVALLIGGMAVASAQSITPIASGEFEVLPKIYSYDGAKFYAKIYDDDEHDHVVSYSILDDDFKVVHEIPAPTGGKLEEYSLVEYRTPVITPTDTLTSDYSYRVLEYLAYDKGISLPEEYQLTIDDCNSYFESDAYYDVEIDSTYTENGRTYFVKRYYVYYNRYETVYTKYPAYYFYLENGKLYQERVDYNTRYTGEWKKEKANVYPTDEKEVFDVNFRNDDTDLPERSDDYTPFLSQTLFNDDADYEFFVVKYVVKAGEPSETDEDGDGEIDHRVTYYGAEPDSWEIVSENGTTLGSVKVDNIDDPYYGDYDYAYLHLFKGKFYLESRWNGYYRIDKGSSSSLQKVAMPTGMKMFPTLARPSDEITIEFEPSANNAVRTLSISDATGRTVEQRTVAPDATRIAVSARRLHAGTYIFTLTENGKQVDNGKIIVK